MATDFFQRQSDAQRTTLWLVSMFGLAVVAIVGTTVAITAVIVRTQLREVEPSLTSHPEQILIPAVAGAITLLIIIGGTAYKVFDLRAGGGTRVAEGLGGRRIYPNTTDPVERRLLNVVEEMALASGTPVPPVFILDEAGINAFAAGYSPSDAVLGVTRGCAKQLTRDELQGVIAHEFSHILNGDMRMNIRLIGILHGILLIGLTGQLIMRTILYSGSGRSRESNNKGGGGQVVFVILAIGIAAIVLGFIGTFFGNLIKAAVSRQREYLADASAVQFTRNPSGIANALKRIGAYVAGSRLKAAGAAEASHMYFAQGVWEGFSGLWATHPPLANRIRAIDPSWDGKFPADQVAAANVVTKDVVGFAGPQAVGSAGREVPVSIVDRAVEQVGGPKTEHQHYAAELIRSLPPTILASVREPYGARAVVYALLLDRKLDTRAIQTRTLHQHTTADVVRLVLQLQDAVDGLDVRTRLPLIDLALPALRAMSVAQFAEFHACFVELAKADQQVDLFEWMLSQVLMRHLQPQFENVRTPRIQYYGLQQLTLECSTLLSIVSAAGNSDAVAADSFQRGAQQLPELELTQRPRSRRALDELREVLAKLTLVVAKHRGRVVNACAAAICADEHVTWQEAELLRGISDLLDCPMPPLLVKT